MPHTKGKWARGGARIHLEPWQVFFLMVLFAWVHAETHLRRFTKAYLCVPRKNGKSIIAAGIGLYMFAADGEHGAEVYSGATTEKQAWEVFRPARLMAEKTPEFLEQFGVEVGARTCTSRRRKPLRAGHRQAG
jgi:phage terminase large subunit-like protein